MLASQTENTVESRIRGFLTKSFGYRGVTATLEGNVDLFDQGILDSTGVLEVVAFLEKDLGLSVQDEELVPEHFGTVNHLVSFVIDKQRDVG